MDESASCRAELTVSDPSQLQALQEYVAWAAPDVHLSWLPGRPATGEQGALDVLVLLASSSGVVAAVRTLPEFIRAGKTGLSVTVRTDGREVTITATNIKDLDQILDHIRT
jgi:hypothetical protein